MPKKPNKSSESTPNLFDLSEPAAPPAGFPADWATALGKQFSQPYFAGLMNFLTADRTAHDVFPAEADVFNAFRFTPFDQVRVVLLGQDPYPTPGHAHGLCFSVRPEVALPASLRNIYKELKSDLGITPPQHGYLADWARRGVLMINAVLTVRSGSPGSHAKKGWETFTDAVLTAVNEGPNRVVFVLWGAYAQKKVPLIDAERHVIIQSAHPSPLSAATGFFGSRPFSKVNEALTSFGLPPIDWTLPATAQE